MITRSEIRVLYERMVNYPAGISSNAWGTGPMAVQMPQREISYGLPLEFDVCTLREHG